MKCRNCFKEFTQYSSLHVACSYPCAAELAKKKEQAKVLRRINLESKEMRIRAKSTDYAKELQNTINKIARMIDEWFNYPCIDCGQNYGNQTDGGHYHSRGSHSALRYHLDNIHSARSECNRFSENHKTGYKEGLIRRYGHEYFDYLESLPLKYPKIGMSPQEIHDKLKIARAVVRSFDKMNFMTSLEARAKINAIIGIYTI